MALNEIIVRNSMPLKYSDACHQSAEVQPVLARQQVPKESVTQTVDVLLIFPSFVTSINLFGRVPWCLSKGGW
jgi:hypothetical protein